jgi:O-antigen/teichoic acid export membrane protein
VANLTAVIIAVKGGGVWSLVSALLITELLRSVLFWVCAGLKFQPVIDFKMWKRLLRFGYNVSLGSVMGFLYGLMDQFAIGKYLGKVQLGFYSLSMTLGTALSTNIIALSNQVILATLSSLQDTEESYFRSYRRGLSIFALIAVPYAVGVFLFGGELLRALYGNKWDGAIIALKILSFYGLAKSLGEINGEVFFSKGKPKYFKYQGTGRVIICLLLLPLVIKYGKMETVALLFTAILSAFVLLTFHWAAKLMKKRLWDILLTFKSHLFAIVGGVILLWLGNLLLEGLAYRIILFYIGYSLVILTLAKDDLQIIWEFIMRLREKDKTSGGNL